VHALTELQAIAVEALAALDTGRQIEPFSSRISSFSLDDANRVTAAVRKMREARGELPVGRKIGFNNRTVWVEYGPIWGYVYNRTVHNLAQIGDTFSLSEGLPWSWKLPFPPRRFAFQMQFGSCKKSGHSRRCRI